MPKVEKYSCCCSPTDIYATQAYTGWLKKSKLLTQYNSLLF